MEEYQPAIEGVEERPRDAKVDEAKALLTRLFVDEPDGVYYQRQLTVRFEKTFFHWITGKALRELEAEGVIGGGEYKPEGWPARPFKFYFPKRKRYWKQEAARKTKLVAHFSSPAFCKALGHHGEIMVTAGLSRAGLVQVAENANSYRGQQWTESKKNLDRIVERAGIGYGVEIKNTLDYIGMEVLEEKMAMCEFLGLVPLFVTRGAPASYIWQLHQAGGFNLVLKWQLYPFGHDDFAAEVRETLGLPVDSPRVLEDGTIKRVSDFLTRVESKRM